MKAIVIREWSSPQQFPLEDVAEPEPGPGEVLVGVHTVGIVFGDTLIATGRYQVRPKLPFTPGAECSGVIEAVGPGVTAYKPGDRIAALGFIGDSRENRTILGACREKIVVPERNLALVPTGIDLEEAALFRSNMETSYLGLQEGRLQAGETLLVLGAGGGTGSAAVALGKALGARVVASASSEEKRHIASQFGADAVVDSKAADWRQQIEAIVGTRGVDVIYDPVGGEQSERAFRTLGYRGRFVIIGFAAGEIPKLPLNLPLLKASSVVGANLLRAWEHEPQRIADNAQYLLNLFAQGRLKPPPIAKRYTLDEADKAFREVADGQTAGRIVMSVGAGTGRGGL